MSSISEWRSDVPYTAGSVVTYQGRKWTAKQWNQNEAPGGASGAWTSSQASALSEWSSTTPYTAGSVVSYNHHKWTAKEWNQNQVPGGPSGVWTDNGAH
ncbi:unnamed protein product [Rhizoctonia solani]|uniref:Chitin-binding type-3 domain-containing protein n=1 Tax=Rhizoctonia solani TaxID=456999 RepID=A0A8H3CC79_9AGAM|nr:unnamed protein product [Rhizoctonia solani]CAE6482384.1 unnamed protein product [Rhizoctonia solani]